MSSKRKSIYRSRNRKVGGTACGRLAQKIRNDDQLSAWERTFDYGRCMLKKDFRSKLHEKNPSRPSDVPRLNLTHLPDRPNEGIQISRYQQSHPIIDVDESFRPQLTYLEAQARQDPDLPDSTVRREVETMTGLMTTVNNMLRNRDRISRMPTAELPALATALDALTENRYVAPWLRKQYEGIRHKINYFRVRDQLIQAFRHGEDPETDMINDPPFEIPADVTTRRTLDTAISLDKRRKELNRDRLRALTEYYSDS